MNFQMLICNRSAKMAPVRAEKKIDFFKIQNYVFFFFLKKSHFKSILDLKTVYFAYKPISDGLF